MNVLGRAMVVLAILTIAALESLTCPACTGVTIKPKDGSVIFARTLEFAMDLKSNVIIVPRGKDYIGTAPGSQSGLRWTTKYAAVGANAFDMPVVIDGLRSEERRVGTE